MAALTLKLADEGWFNLSGNGYEDVSLISNNGIYSVLWTSAALFATTENLARWCSALFHGQVLNEESLDLMLQPCCTMPGTTDVGCAMGLFLISPSNNTGVELIGYTGRTFGYLTSMFYLPGNEMSIAVMINEDNSQLLDEVTTVLILEALETALDP
jgi:CubicO group peptidase (beta-lactamase class C family)